MNIIFVGSFYPHEREDEIRRNSKCGIDNASNNLQWAFLEGFDYYYPNLKVIAKPFIRTYPLKYKKIFFKSSIFSHKPGVKDYCLGFVNLQLIKHLDNTNNLYKILKKIISIGEETTIIIYGVHSPFLKAVVDLKKKNNRIKICLIVPDLPQFMSESRNQVYRFFKSIDSILINNYLKSIDSFVLLSDYMADELRVGNRPWTRVEGIFTSNSISVIQMAEDLKIILYTGTLDKRYGIMNLLDAFCLIEDRNYRLWICGDGNCKNEVIRNSFLDDRIRYWGQISYEEVLILQKRATVLVNPRTSEGEYTKFSFPSKTMEYIASGRPCVMHRLPGIPSEYYDYIFIAEREDAEGLKETILHVCSKDQSELNDFGKKASQFILENKNPITQVKKIYDMINKL